MDKINNYILILRKWREENKKYMKTKLNNKLNRNDKMFMKMRSH